MQAAPEAAGQSTEGAESAPDMSNGFTIELNVGLDGKMTVSVEPAAEESSEEGSGSDGSDDDEAQPVANIGEALKLIREIVAHAGQMTDTSASNDEMSSGYGSGN